MQTLEYALLGFGLIFPLLSWITSILSLLLWWREKRHFSAVFIPFIGPILLTNWVLLTHNPYWLIPIVWFADIGTLMFLAVCPTFIKEWWRTSSLTMVLKLEGRNTNQSAIITLYSSGQYLLRKTWKPDNVVGGMASLGETGTYSTTKDSFELIAHHGLHRTLRKMEAGAYSVEEALPPSGDQNVYTLHGWSFKPDAETNQA